MQMTQSDGNHRERMGISQCDIRAAFPCIIRYCMASPETLGKGPRIKALFPPSLGPHPSLLGGRSLTNMRMLQFSWLAAIWMEPTHLCLNSPRTRAYSKFVKTVFCGAVWQTEPEKNKEEIHFATLPGIPSPFCLISPRKCLPYEWGSNRRYW